LGIGRNLPCPTAILPRDRLRRRSHRTAKVKSDHVVIGCLLVVVIAELVATACHATWIVGAKSPAANVDHVHAVIAEFAGAPVPEPMPMVMNEVIAVRAFGCGALPERPVEPRGRGSFLAVPDRRT